MSGNAISLQKSHAAGSAVHHYRIPVEGIQKKVIYHFSDVHLAEYYSLSSEEEKCKAINVTRYWEALRYDFANNHNEAYTAMQQQSAYSHFLNLLAVAQDGDALVLAGDICDYINSANLRILDTELGKFPVPFLSVLGNHEKCEEIPKNHILSQSTAPTQILDLSEFVIFGIDNSLRQVTAEQNEQLKDVLLQGKPLIIAMHVPIMTEDNKEQLLECGEYFQLNHANAPEEVHDFIEIIQQNASRIIAVFAGHLHFANNTEITAGVTQYVSSQGVLGNINRYEIGI